MIAEERFWNVPVRVDEVHEIGRHIDLRADEAARARVAQAVDLPSVSRLEGAFEVTRRGADGLHVAGRVSATIGQTCIVTLEPMTSEIDERVDVVFSPSAEPHEPRPDDALLEIAVGEREPLVNGTVDLGALAVEFLLLGIDPYPRKPGAVFQAPVTDDAAAHPFAGLAALKKGLDDTEK